MIYIFDIDGTLADLKHRLHFIQQEPADWKAFYAAASGDEPIWEVITVARSLGKAGNTIIVSSGRSDEIKELTTAWLTKYRVPFHDIYMRKEGDHREDNVVKSELYDLILNDYNTTTVAGVFEDRQQVVDMYRARGVRVFQVAEGKF